LTPEEHSRRKEQNREHRHAIEAEARAAAEKNHTTMAAVVAAAAYDAKQPSARAQIDTVRMLTGQQKRRAHDRYHHGGGKEKRADRYHHGGGKEKKAGSPNEWYLENKEEQHEKYHSKEGITSRNEKKAAAIDDIAAANGGKGYRGLGTPTNSGSYKIIYNNFLQEKAGFELVLTIKDVDGAALVFAKLHEVRAQLLGEAYQSETMYKKRLEETAHNGSSYGELGAAAGPRRRCCCRRRRR
jgi:hypothetical protein